MRFRVNHDEGFLVVACHELQYNAITETSHEGGGGCEVKTTPPGGEFTLSLPKGRLAAHPATHLTISKPGFEVHEGTFKPEESDPYYYRPDEDGILQINIYPATSYRAEAVANIRAVPREYESLDAAQKRAVDQYLAAREADLAKRYPTEVAEARARRAPSESTRSPTS